MIDMSSFGRTLSATYTAIMPATSQQLWDAIYRLRTDDDTAMIAPDVIDKLIEFKMVELGAAGLPHLTGYGENCFLILESGDDSTTEIDDLAAVEDQQSQWDDGQRVK